MNRYEVQGTAGQGAYGIVIRARTRQNGQIVAIKKMSHSKNPLGILREICSLRNLNHKNILTLLDNFSSADTVSIVTEFVSFHLNDILLDPRRPRDDLFIQFFFEQLLLAVAHMHSVGIMHRDLKPENILVTSTLIVKVADFGQACLYYPSEPNREYEENVATRWYRAPELLFGCRRYTPSIDIWAIGLCLAEFVTGYPLLQGRSDIEQMSRVFGLLGTPSEQNWPSWEIMPDAGKLIFEERPPLKDWSTISLDSAEGKKLSVLVTDASPELLKFLKLMLKLDTFQRASAQSLLENNWMKGPFPKPNYQILRRTMRLYSRRRDRILAR